MKSILYLILTIGFLSAVSAQNTYVPDDNFEQRLIGLGYDEGPLDDYVPTANIENVTRLYIVNRGIKDLTGIEAFTALEEFYCSGNPLNELDLSSNLQLKELYCNQVFVGTLDLRDNINLTFIRSNYSYLTEIRLDGLSELIEVDLSYNNIENIDISAAIKLRYLTLNNNNLSTVELNNHPELVIFSLSNNNLTSIDLSQLSGLATLRINNNLLTDLDLSNNLHLLRIYCNGNSLNYLDLSHTSCFSIFINDNQLTELILPEFIPELPTSTSQVYLSLENNQLTRIDVSDLLVRRLLCSNNQLEFLDVRNGSNDNIIDFEIADNPNLTCVYVDDKQYSQDNWTLSDATTNFVESEAECNALDVPLFTEDDVSIYPNPAKNHLSVQTDFELDYELYDINGKSLKIGVLNIGNNSMDISQLSAGIYYLYLKNDDSYVVRKVVKG